jgi:glucosamine 6-phosphate synthetase-like amidotransferase/phosphosugar isomerase protein
MCGVFGFVARGNKGMNMEVLKGIARVTMSRGPHAWGMAWIDGMGRLKMFKQTGRIVDHLAILRIAADARCLIGHCRFATQGDPANNLNNHPHPADGGWLVHNGQIRDYFQVVEGLDLYPNTHCDSEILGLLIEQTKGRLIDRCVEAVLTLKKAPLVILGVWKPGRLVAVRQGNPLHLGTTKHGYYLASLADGLPGTVREVADDSAIELSGKGLNHVTF